jgi:hypothetical protein
MIKKVLSPRQIHYTVLVPTTLLWFQGECTIEIQRFQNQYHSSTYAGTIRFGVSSTRSDH